MKYVLHFDARKMAPLNKVVLSLKEPLYSVADRRGSTIFMPFEHCSCVRNTLDIDFDCAKCFCCVLTNLALKT